MWQCLKCGETVDDTFTECWNCRADRDGLLPEEDELSAHQAMRAENRMANVNEQASSINCLRCQRAVEYAGKKHIHAGFIFEGKLSLRMYICPHCGHVEFFV